MASLVLTDSNFKNEVLESGVPVLVDFWAPWCGPCKKIASSLEELAQEYAGRLKVGKLNIDDNPRTPTQYGIMSIPTLIFFSKGQVVEQVGGALSKPELKHRIEGHLA